MWCYVKEYYPQYIWIFVLLGFTLNMLHVVYTYPTSFGHLQTLRKFVNPMLLERVVNGKTNVEAGFTFLDMVVSSQMTTTWLSTRHVQHQHG